LKLACLDTVDLSLFALLVTMLHPGDNPIRRKVEIKKIIFLSFNLLLMYSSPLNYLSNLPLHLAVPPATFITLKPFSFKILQLI
jgi:hypothetical protein